MLTGGASRRMGRDKALLPVRGQALAASVTAALVEAGAGDVFCVGGDAAGLAALGLAVIPDAHPGEGPLGGLVTALGAATEELVVVLACDLPAVTPTGIRRLVEVLDASPGAVWAAPREGERWQHLHGAYRRRTRDQWDAAFTRGERSLHRAASSLPGVEVTGVTPEALADVDRPEDLRGGP